MRYVDEYRDESAARRLLAAIARDARHPWTLMEICGGQTHTLLRSGIDRMLPETITLVHGPGCPVASRRSSRSTARSRSRAGRG